MIADSKAEDFEAKQPLLRLRVPFDAMADAHSGVADTRALQAPPAGIELDHAGASGAADQREGPLPKLESGPDDEGVRGPGSERGHVDDAARSSDSDNPDPDARASEAELAPSSGTKERDW
jgi:hypothetical protein